MEGASDHHEKGLEYHDEEGHLDPHVWLSPVLAQKEVQTIKNTLVKKDPKNKEYYENYFSFFKAIVIFNDI